jgi:hypothetical protein
MTELSVTPKPKLPLKVHLMCGWPLLLVAVGGAIGGLLGGLAYGANLAVYRSKLAVPLKVVLNIAAGLAAFGLWLLAAKVVRSAL